jgi:tRNA dimethylallyltransferase
VKPLLLVIAGPTGVGKTAAAVALGARVPIEIVSADSRQVYRGMDIGTAKPTPAERAAVAHHLIDVTDPDDRYHASRFAREARAAIDAIRARGHLPVVAGGTGLYIRALVRGLDPAPPADPDFRRALYELGRQESGALHTRLSREAPAMAQRLHPNDHVRIVRALELLRAGAPVGESQRRWRDAPETEDAVLYVGLTLPRDVLATRLRARAAAMLADGLADEVRTLLARGYDPSLPAMQGIGYRELALVLAGEIGEAEALRRMQRDTVRYAKRQWTWFTREPDIQWLDIALCGGTDGIARLLAERVDRAMSTSVPAPPGRDERSGGPQLGPPCGVLSRSAPAPPGRDEGRGGLGGPQLGPPF